MPKSQVLSAALKKYQSKRFIKDEVIILAPVKEKTRRHNIAQQAINRKYDRQAAKAKYVPKIRNKKEYKELYKHVRKYKSALSKQYRIEVKEQMKNKGYFPEHIKRAEKYSLVGMNVKLAVIKTDAIRWRRNNREAFVNGKWISAVKQVDRMKRAVKKARINSYQDILGIDKNKAKKIYDIITKDKIGSNEIKALIY